MLDVIVDATAYSSSSSNKASSVMRTPRRSIVLVLSACLVLAFVACTLSDQTTINKIRGISRIRKLDGSSNDDASLKASERFAGSESASDLDVDYDAVDRGWCPDATCSINHICKTCERRFLIVIATGRSASTSLTWMLNTLPGVRMSGENNDAIKQIKNMVDGTVGEIEKNHHANIGGPWGHNAFAEGSVSCLAQDLFEVLNPPENVADVPSGSASNERERHDTILGFKTVRLHQRLTKEMLPEVIQFLKESFPCARFLVNYRSDLEAQAESVQKAFNYKAEKENIEYGLEEANEMLLEIGRLLGETRAYVLDSTAWTQNVTVLNQAVEWLGFNEYCEFKELLEFNTQGTGYGAGNDHLDVDSRCKYTGGKYER